MISANDLIQICFLLTSTISAHYEAAAVTLSYGLCTPSKTAKDTDTNKRLHTIFQKYLSEGRKIAFDVGDVEQFEINGVRFGGDTMHDPFKRLAVENILLAFAQKSGEYELLNVFVDRVADAVDKLSKLPPHEVKRLLELFAKKDQRL